MKKHTEARLEDAIVAHLVAQGGYVLVDYAKGPPPGVLTRHGRSIQLWC
jgi:hypothetical protein